MSGLGPYTATFPVSSKIEGCHPIMPDICMQHQNLSINDLILFELVHGVASCGGQQIALITLIVHAQLKYGIKSCMKNHKI